MFQGGGVGGGGGGGGRGGGLTKAALILGMEKFKSKQKETV